MGRTTQGTAGDTRGEHSPVLLSALIHCIRQRGRFVPLPLFPSLEYQYTKMSFRLHNHHV